MIEGLQDVLKADSARSTKMDCTASVEEYINKSDWRINANANTSYSNSGLVNNLAGKAIANYWLDKVFSKKEGDAHREGDYHIHDLDCLTPYCFTSDTKIKTVDFGDISIKELLEKDVTNFTVISFDGEKQVECNAHDLRCTRKDAELVEVEFEDGLVVRCTPDHKFLALTPETDPETHEAYLKVEWKPAAYLTMRTVRKAYTCPIIKSDVIKLEEVEGVITESDAKNSFAKVISVKPLDYKEDVYCMTVDETHCFALENGVIAHNCCGHDLQDLLQHGFNGVVSRASSKPPKHLREALGQMANFIGILQSEWAGAQAFSSFDTLLAPYVFYDMMVEGIDERDVKKAILSFVYNLNVPSRWGQCVPVTYKCKKTDGTWATVDELKIGDEICVFDVETGKIKTDVITHLNVFDVPEKMHFYENKKGQSFVVTPNHRVIIKDGDKFIIQESEEILKTKKETVFIPTEDGVDECIVGVEGGWKNTDKVWCPTTNTGTFVCMTDEGYVFFTGNSPFSNITIDMTVPQNMRFLSPQRGNEPYFVRNWREFLEAENLTDDPDEALERNEGWNRLIEEARARIGDYDSDEETILYSLTYQYFKKEMMIINKAYYEVLSEGDSVGQPFTFPIPTVNITEDFDWDDPDYDFLFENAARYGSSYFNNFIGSQYLRDENGNLTIRNENAISKDDTRSMCPLTHDTKIIVRSRWEASYKEIGHVYNSMKRGTKYECFYKGAWIPCNVIRVSNQDLYEIRVANNKTYKMGAYHEQPIIRDGIKMTIMAKDIREGDLIPFNNAVLCSDFIKSSYELGFALGAYLGDGSRDNVSGIVYSLDAREKDNETENRLTNFWEGLGYRVSKTITSNLRTLRIGAGSFNVISRYVTGRIALNKGITPLIITQSVDMRMGIIDGLIATDGDREKSRIWTSSEVLVEDLINLFNSVGIKAYKSFTDERDGRLGTNPCYCVSFIKERENYKGKYKTIDGDLYWYVTGVENKGMYTKGLYCLETDTEHHLFTLSDGLITHNCRLRLDKREIRKRGGGLFGSESRTGSTGVVTINMARLGYLHKGDIKGLYKKLDKLCDLAHSVLTKRRAFVEEMYKRGLYPYTRRYVPSYNTYFSTIGVNGMNEMVRNFTNDEYDISDKRGQKMCEEILDHINEKLVEYQETGTAMYNLEAAPAEGCLHFDTKVLTIDGAKKIGELCGEQVPVLSYNKDTKRMEYKKADFFFDSVTEKVYKITFDNGYTLECTSEHPFAVRHWNGVKGEEMYWSPASALKVGDRIKSAYVNISLHGYKRYGKHFFEHRGVYEYFNGKIPEGHVIHHKDGNKFNNDISNLMLMTEKEHKSYHIKEMIDNGVIEINNEGENNPFYGKKHSDETKQKISEAKCKLTDEEKDAIIEAYSAGLEFKQMSRMFGMTTQPMDFIRRIGMECRESTTYPKVNSRAIEYLYNKGYSDEEIVNILRGHNTLSIVRDVILSLTEENHKVVSIEILHKKMPVYNASVEDNQNFYVGDDENGYVLTHNTTTRFAREDIKRYPDIIQAGFPDAPYYTNSSQLPVDFTADVFTALDLQDELQCKYSGGTVFHIYNDEDVTAEECKLLLKKILTNYRLPYVSFTATFSTCPKHGRISGIHEYCPLCDKELMEKHIHEIDLNKA